MSDRHLTLTALRKRSGMSLNELAKAMGYNGQSSIQRYFAPTYDLGFRPEIAKKFRSALLGKGNPPITESDLRVFTDGEGCFSVSPPSDHSPEGLRLWISETCRILGVTPTEISKSADLAPSTINRFLRSSDDANLSARTIEVLVETARKIEAEGGGDANRIAEQRTKKGMTQQQLADVIGVHWMTISKLERGEMQLTARWMDKICAALNVQYQDLLNPQPATRQANGLTLNATLPCVEGEITVEMPKALDPQTAEAALAWFTHLVGLTRKP